MGFSEWMVWSYLEHVVVEMLLGQYVVDVISVSAPALRPASPKGTHRVCAVRLLMSGEWRAAASASDWKFDANHFVIGCRIQGVEPPASSSSFPSLPKAQTRCARLCAADVGRFSKETAAQGDCATDVMAYFRGWSRSAEDPQRPRRLRGRSEV
jgi:hypothetical protein